MMDRSEGGKTTYASLALTEADHAAYERALESFRAYFGKRYPIFTPREVMTGDLLEDRNPSRKGEVVARFPKATSFDVSHAVHAGRNIARDIEEMGFEQRIEILRRASTIIERIKFEVAAVLTLEAGKNPAEALAEVNEVKAMIDAYIDSARQCGFYEYILCSGPKPPYEISSSVARPYRKPWVVISPFNFPFALAANMSIPAFLAGNPLIFKPASDTPLATLYWRNVLVEAGVPEEACSFLVGPGAMVGEALIRHRDIAGVAFTGSLAVGKRIMAAHYDLFEHNAFRAYPVMEMGGKNAVIVTACADLDAAAEGIIRAAVGYTGQKCSATSRVYVEKSIFSGLWDRLLSVASNGFPNGQKITVGFPEERGTYVGPLINQDALDRYYWILKELTSRQGVVIGALCDTESLPRAAILQEHGYFVSPFMVTGLSHNDPLNHMEHFVPFVALHQVGSLEEAVRKANDAPYGLCAGIFSEDEGEVGYFFESIEAGVAYANRRAGATTGAWPMMQSFGGWKGSGTSGRNSFGKWYMLNFLREQCMTVA